jgi:hypothetical protein
MKTSSLGGGTPSRVSMRLGAAAVRQPQHAQAALRHVRRVPQDGLAGGSVQRQLAVGGQPARRHAHHPLWRALDEHPMLLAPRADAGGVLQLRLERDFAHYRVLRPPLLVVEARPKCSNQQRGFRRVAVNLVFILADAPYLRLVGQHGGQKRQHERVLVIVGDCAVLQFMYAVPLARRPVFLHGHAVLGERARFVGADDGRAAERFDGVQAAHERVAFRHRAHTQRERNRQHDRQPFGHGGDRHADHHLEHVHDAVADRQPQREDDRTADADDYADDVREAAHAPLQRRLIRALLAHAARDFAQLGVRACGDHIAAPAPRRHNRARKDHDSRDRPAARLRESARPACRPLPTRP